jgi:hypothetical protein
MPRLCLAVAVLCALASGLSVQPRVRARARVEERAVIRAHARMCARRSSLAGGAAPPCAACAVAVRALLTIRDLCSTACARTAGSAHRRAVRLPSSRQAAAMHAGGARACRCCARRACCCARAAQDACPAARAAQAGVRHHQVRCRPALPHSAGPCSRARACALVTHAATRSPSPSPSSSSSPRRSRRSASSSRRATEPTARARRS